MLLLTCRPQETIILTTPDGTEIRVTVMNVFGNQVEARYRCAPGRGDRPGGDCRAGGPAKEGTAA